MQMLRRYLPKRGLSLCVPDARICWTPRLLVICAILMSFSVADSLKDRFDDARLATVRMYGSRRRPGKTYDGFIATLCKHSGQLLELVTLTLRQMVLEIAGPHQRVEGWLLFGADGTRVECPMTEANEAELGCAGKKRTTPQQYLTMLLHLGSGLPWAFVRGAGTSSERGHLRQMLPLLPAEAMLVADAGFVGYDVLKAMMDSGRHFVIRVGSNVQLIRKLGYFQEREGIVYLWPLDKQRRRRDGSLPRNLAEHAHRVQPPLVLRLEVFEDRRHPVHLLSSVLDERVLSGRTMAALYRRRWGLELYYRSLKQTMARRKMLSDSPEHAGVELDWCVVGLWMLGMAHVEALIAAGHSPERASVASGLRVLRKAMKDGTRRCRRGALGQELAEARLDEYQRHTSKQSRHGKNKKTQRPPGKPRIRRASGPEVRLARELQKLGNPAPSSEKRAPFPTRSRPHFPRDPRKSAAKCSGA